MTIKKTPDNPERPPNQARRLNWEEEKKKIQYDIELKALKSLLNKLIELDKALYDINAGRNQYHKG
jgi:hypothetical protein